MSGLQSLAGFVNRSVAVGLCCSLFATPMLADDHGHTTTPIKHIVVIFQENRSFDQYFASYPFAANLAGEPPVLCATENSQCQRASDGRTADVEPQLREPAAVESGGCDRVQRFA